MINIELTKLIHEKMMSQQFVMSVIGNINQELLRSVIKVTEKKLETSSMPESMKHRIFHFMIECSQNLCKTVNSDRESNTNIFLISKKDNDYFIYLGNMFETTEAEALIEIVDKVNSMNAVEVKDEFFKGLSKWNLDNQNSLLISLLDISKRTKEKIVYELMHVNEKNKFICFKTRISSLKES